jgi:leucyl-tRNA synthetase
MHRFLQRLWRLIVDESTGETAVSAAPLDAATARLLHQTITAVSEDFAALHFNTAIARLITLTTHAARPPAGQPQAGHAPAAHAPAGQAPRVPRALAEPLVLMVAPLAPHIAEELWHRLGHPSSLAYEPFPQPDPALAAVGWTSLPVQVGGKVRFTIDVPAGASQQEIADLLAAHPEYPRDEVARLVIVPGKIVSVVLR